MSQNNTTVEAELSGDESGLPEGWRLVSLAEIVQPSTSKVEPRSVPEAKYLSLEHIEANTTRIVGRGVGADVGSTKATFNAGDVLYGKLRPYLNKVCIPEFDGICSTDILVFPASPALDNRFLLRFLTLPEVVQYANHNSTGVNLPRISFESLGQLRVSLPPIAEQRRIVAKIEECLAPVNAARQRLARVAGIVKRFRQSVLAAACSGRLTADWREEPDLASFATSSTEDLPISGHVATSRRKSNSDKRLPIKVDEKIFPELPPTWGHDRLGNICSHVADIDHKMPKSVPIGVKFLSAKDLWDDGTLNLTENIKLISEEDYQRLSRKIRPQRGDVIYSRIGARLGKARIVDTDERFLVSYSCCVVRPIDTDPRYIASFLNCSQVLERALSDSKSIGVPDLGLQEIKDFVIPLPPLTEQAEIVRRVEALFALADAIETRLAHATTRVEKIAQAVLAKAFRGELVPTEAELARQEGRDYEPASALLARVRAVREGGNAGKGKGRRVRAVG